MGCGRSVCWKGWKSPSAPWEQADPWTAKRSSQTQKRGLSLTGMTGSPEREQMSMKEQSGKAEKKMIKRKSTSCLWGQPQEQSKQGGGGGLTLEQLPRSSLADRWSWTAVLKRWLSRKKNSSGSYIPAKGVVRNTGALKVSIMARLVLFCLTGVMLATYSPC